ncbi:MAG: hypothetical protein NWE92_07540 [Candidatus Bathyarchaeota archaeon]|nr:hypothetical protein [Candidatus Bathyarchaeota archaeon]
MPQSKVSIFCLTLAVVVMVSFGNLAQANPIYERGDLTVAIIESPQSKTYITNVIPITLVTGCHVFLSTGYYSIDGGPEVVINENIGQSATFRTSVNFTDGVHHIHLRTGNMLTSCADVYFTVNTSVPFVSLVSPENRVYNTSTVPLHFSLLDESVVYVTYNLDDTGNVTVRVLHPYPPEFPEELTWYPLANQTEGTHHVTVFAEDDFGNSYSADTSFVIDTKQYAAATPTVSPPEIEREAVGAVPINVSVTVAALAVVAAVSLVIYYRKKMRR